jgi:hypothetical protein
MCVCHVPLYFCLMRITQLYTLQCRASSSLRWPTAWPLTCWAWATVMMTRDGHFFHTTSEHILCNFKTKSGMFTNDTVHIAAQSRKLSYRPPSIITSFIAAVKATGALGLYAPLVSLFSLAIPCNLPELQTEKDVL